MKHLARLSKEPDFKYDWNSITDNNQRIIAESCVTGYAKKFKELQRKAGNLIREDMHAKALCVHHLKTHLGHGLFLQVSEEALGLNKDTAAALATLGKGIHEGWLNGDILEMIKEMEPRAASKLVRADEETKRRHVAMFREAGIIPSRKSLESKASNSDNHDSEQHTVSLTAHADPTDLEIVSITCEAQPPIQSQSASEALDILLSNHVRTIDACGALTILLRRQESASSTACDVLRELKIQVDYLLSQSQAKC